MPLEDMEMRTLPDSVKFKLIVLVEELKAKFEDDINAKLINGLKCSGITGDSAKRLFRLACALDVIDKPSYDVLFFLVDRRNEAAHNKPVQLEFDDFPTLEKVLQNKKTKELNSRKDTLEGHYLAILDAIHQHFI
ncbi:hypothetical protein ES703_105648 [subsurface metagenome]